MHPVLIVRRVPRRAAGLDAGVVAVETVTAAAAAHVLAGGGTPDVASLVVLALLGYGAGLAVLGRGASIRVVAPVMVAAQLFLHAWWTSSATGHAAHAAHGHSVGSATGPTIGPLALPGLPALPDTAMLLAHVAAGVVAAAAWALRRRVVDVLVRWSARHRVAVPPCAPVPATGRAASPVARLLVHVAPTRGPPAGVGVAAA